MHCLIAGLIGPETRGCAALPQRAPNGALPRFKTTRNYEQISRPSHGAPPQKKKKNKEKSKQKETTKKNAATPPTARPHFLLPADPKPQKFVQIALRCCLPPIFSFSRKAKNGRNLQPSSAAPSGSATFRNSSTYRPQKKYSQRHGRGLGTSQPP